MPYLSRDTPFKCLAEEQKRPLAGEDLAHLARLLEEVLGAGQDPANDIQKMLNYVKKREIDTLRQRTALLIVYFMET